ncbi:LPXTG cell wall anchor domain-containing protein [Streptococcus suis]|uniref:LPXTG cell wall anchor domain-containing protein n=1 Tax=Streptococcus suis TaxID=1307 RepID=UPI001C93EE40|nr:LPXTG cell wall anchor domain-containing protein [Streptococcus suis]MBY4956460.1 LPXTG cell wall anchor domain-containing protein [Streptococcus suis]MBY4980644.1 LPXTG cell wall anchor domain-containing protein [Streptococcus suis]MBY4991496.1 LPXTG cell wall anchor domain-containing protein [Streptococcus suis]MBY5006753.1 LPXTG cell wall anchor domain-containing protein [Streptococcus suis]MBY5017553.1 LPXTG cell wall anchor domain-containing protein [Streptococcus suis]
MKIKRSSSKKQLHKWTKLGVGLAAVTVLGGLVEPVGLADFGLTKVYATEQADPALEARKIEIKTMIQSYRDLVGQIKALNPADYTEESWNKNYDGDVRIYLGAQSIATAYNDDLTFSSLSLDGVDSHQTLNELNATYMFGYIYVENSIPVLKQAMADLVPVSESVETPTDKPAENPVEQPEPAGDTNSTDTNTVNYTIQLVDQDGQVLQTIQQSGVEGTEVSFDFPVISGYRVGKTEGFDSWTYGKGGTFRLVANKTVKVYYDKAPSIDSLIRPEQRVEYQKVFDTFHTTVLKAFEVYKKELGVDHIIRLTEDEAKFNQITQSEDLTTLQLELILVENLFNEPVGLVLTDQDIINAIGWTPEYWDYQIAYHKEITQKLEKAMANIAASKAIPTVPVDQSITIKAVYTEEQIEPGQKVDVLKEIEYTLKPGESVVLEPLAFEGWTSRVVQESQTVTYEEAKARPNKEYYFYYIEEGTTPTEKPIETPAETPTEKPAEQLVEKPTEQPVEKLVERPTASPTGQSASEKQATKQGDKEPAAPASQSKQSTVKPASTSQSQAKTLPATGEASSVLHLTGLGLLGLAGLVVKRRSGKSS